MSQHMCTASLSKGVLGMRLMHCLLVVSRSQRVWLRETSLLAISNIQLWKGVITPGASAYRFIGLFSVQNEITRRAPIMWHVRLCCHTQNRKRGSDRVFAIFVSSCHSKFQRSKLKKQIVTLHRPTLVAVWAQDQGRATVPTHQLQVFLASSGWADAMAESALKSKGETSEGQWLLSTGYVLWLASRTLDFKTT